MADARKSRLSWHVRYVVVGIFSALVLAAVPGSASASPDVSSGTKAGEIELVTLDKSVDLKACKKFGKSKSWGAMGGEVCKDPSRLEGWVEDKKDDEWCVVVVVEWWKDDEEAGEDESPAVCEKGDREEFESTPDDEDADKVVIKLTKREKEDDDNDEVVRP